MTCGDFGGGREPGAAGKEGAGVRWRRGVRAGVRRRVEPVGRRVAGRWGVMGTGVLGVEGPLLLLLLLFCDGGK